MHRKCWVCCGIGLALASLTLACGGPAEQAQAPPVTPPQAPAVAPPRPPGTNEVVLTVTCPPEQANGAAFRVVVHPPTKWVDAGEDVVWTREKRGAGTHSRTFSITPANASLWPWTSSSTPLWTGDTAITGTAKDTQDTSEQKYTITVGCNGDTIVIDPRMKVNN